MYSAEKVILGITESICPVCLKKIPAKKVKVEENVYLEKDCPDHGSFRTIIWRGQPDYLSWGRTKVSTQPEVCLTEVNQGCPFDCGLCPDHRQSTCCVLLEVTSRCNLSCPICFAESNAQGDDPDIKKVETMYRKLMAAGGPYNIQLSGGEPTVRDDLPEIIRLGKSIGYEFFQVNTNGLRLASDIRYVKHLKEAGLSCVFLQFDGTDDSIYRKIRGRDLFELKKKAIENCHQEELGVVLVPTLVPKINVDNIGDIIQFALDSMPAVRGVHFQPISYFGRYPKQPSDEDRITIPEVLREIETQTNGRMLMTDFQPPSAENAYCSFNGNFVLMEHGELKQWRDSNRTGCCCQPQKERVKKAQKFVAKHWSAPPNNKKIDTVQPVEAARMYKADSLDAFLDRIERYSLAISGMAFQDAWTLDLERLRECFIHVVSKDCKVIPFCAFNLTDCQGKALYRS
jgi:7,8-dihydro-6-hydroxymethylpterin dimethyltransferase